MLGRLRQRRHPLLQGRAGKRLAGMAGMLGVGLALFLAVARPNPFATSHDYWAVFQNVNGLGKIQRDIRLAGVNVGTLGSVERVGDHAKLQLQLTEDIPLHTDARAALRPHTLFEGSAFVDLSPGSPSAPLLPEGSVIPLSHTRVYVSLDQALRVLRPPIRNNLRDLAGIASKTLRRRSIEGVQRTLKNLPALSRELGPTAVALQGPTGSDLAGAILGASETVHGVASARSQLEPLVQRANRTLAAVEVDSGKPLDAVLAALPGALEELRRGGGNLNRLLDRLDRLAVGIRPAIVQLTPALRGLRPLLARSIPVLRRAVPEIAQQRIVLARLTAAAPDLTRLLKSLLPGARIMGEKLLPFLHRDSRLGVPTYIQLDSLFEAGTGALRPYQTAAQNSLGEGHLIRLGAYGDPNSFGGTLIPSCADFAILDPQAAAALQGLGICAP